MRFPNGDPRDTRDHVFRLTLVNIGGPNASPPYSEDTGLCICSTETFQSEGPAAAETCMSLQQHVYVGCFFFYPWWGLRQSLDQGGAMRKGFGGFRRGRADRQGHRSGLFLNSRMWSKGSAIKETAYRKSSFQPFRWYQWSWGKQKGNQETIQIEADLCKRYRWKMFGELGSA